MMYHSYCQYGVSPPPSFSLPVSTSLSVSLPSLSLWTHIQSPVEAVMKPSSLHHTQLPSCSGITHFNDAFSHGAIQIGLCNVYPPATKAPQTAPLVKMQLVLVDNYGQFSTKGCHFGALLILRNFPGRSRT